MKILKGFFWSMEEVILRWKSKTIRQSKFYPHAHPKSDLKSISNIKLKKTLDIMKRKLKVPTFEKHMKAKKFKNKKINEKPKKFDKKEKRAISNMRTKGRPEFPSQRMIFERNPLNNLMGFKFSKRDDLNHKYSCRTIQTKNKLTFNSEKQKKKKKAKPESKLKDFLDKIKERSSNDKSPVAKKKNIGNNKKFKSKFDMKFNSGKRMTKMLKNLKGSGWGYKRSKTPKKKTKKKKPKKKKKKIKSKAIMNTHSMIKSFRQIRPGTSNVPRPQNSIVLEEIRSVSSKEVIFDDQLERDIIKKKKYSEFKENLARKVESCDEFERVVETVKDTFQDTSPNSWMLIFQTSLDYYHIEGEIGKGSFAKVYKAKQILTNTSVALKKICKKTIRLKGVEEKIQREIKILKNLNDHPNIVRLIEEFEDEEFYYLVFEFLEKGDLVSFFKTNDLFKGEQLKEFFYKILEGLKHIHMKGVIHRDIKPENILFDSRLRPKIADFGISTIYRKKHPIKDTGGTPIYLAPEVIENKGEICFNTDIWSCGILFFLLAVGDVPFKADDVQVLYGKILNDPFKIPKNMRNQEMNEGLDDLLKGMLMKNSKKRWTLSKCMRHPWFRPYNKNIRKKKLIRESNNRSKSQNLSANNSKSLTKSKLLSFASDLKERLMNPGQAKRNDSQLRKGDIQSCRKIPFGMFQGLEPRLPNAIERQTIQKKTKTEKKKIDNFDTFFNSSTEFITTNSKNFKSQRKIKKLTLAKKELDELKVTAVIDFLTECQFPKKYILDTVFAKDKQFTHIKSCFDQLIESL
jgi:serine/threonine protein kinase